jgi:hypothetical protein
VDDPEVSLGATVACVTMPMLYRNQFLTEATNAKLALPGSERSLKQLSQPVLIKCVRLYATPQSCRRHRTICTTCPFHSRQPNFYGFGGDHRNESFLPTVPNLDDLRGSGNLCAIE